jgi:DNA (cytosine-5)-methyltransferase 1
MSQRHSPTVPVIDLFAGPGGLGEGFSALETSDGLSPFRIGLSIEKDPNAHSTLRLRAFFRQFRRGDAPDKYYAVLRGDATVEELYKAFPTEAAAANREAWNATLGEVARKELNERIGAALGGSDRWVLIGGPPCQAYSLAGRSRNAGIKTYRAEDDRRQYLYVEYLQVIADHWPAVFIMENVKGLLSASLNNERLFQRIVDDLTSPRNALNREGRSVSEPQSRSHKYRIVPIAATAGKTPSAVTEYVVAAQKHGVPQARQRVILVGIRDDLGAGSPSPLDAGKAVTVSDVIDDLPELRSGLSRKDSADGWLKAFSAVEDRRWYTSIVRKCGPEVQDLIAATVRNLACPAKNRGSAFIKGSFVPKHEPKWYHSKRLGGICHHESRGHLETDLHRYLFVSAFGQVHGRSPTLKDFPADLLPDHENAKLAAESGGNFSDRFRVQLATKPSTTITSHIAKDGHYYIHPDPAQCRSLTLREAARLQTFPDDYFFCGPRTMGYGQVGNAVPPLLARSIAASIWAFLSKVGFESRP